NMLVENGGGGNWVKFILKGTGKNSHALGAVVNTYTRGALLKLENYPVHGYQSSMQAPLQTGLPSPKIDSVLIQWPDGKIERFLDIKVNTTNTISYQAGQKSSMNVGNSKPVFSTSLTSLPYMHVTSETNDFK